MATIDLRGPDRDDDIFTSVFPRPHFTTPTPENTPSIGVLSSPGGEFGGPQSNYGAASDAVKLTRAWSEATRYLASSLDPEYFKTIPSIREISLAVERLLSQPATRKDLITWHMNQVSSHFRQHVLPNLQDWTVSLKIERASELLANTVKLLQTAQRKYVSGFEAMLQSEEVASEQKSSITEFCNEILHKFHVVVLNSLPAAVLECVLAEVLYRQTVLSLKENSEPQRCIEAVACRCQPSLDALPLALFREVGLGGDLGERAFAKAMHKFVLGPTIQRPCFQVDWSWQRTVVPRLRLWIWDCLAPFIRHTLSQLSESDQVALKRDETQKLAELAVGSLGRHRAGYLFDYVKSWPQSRGAVLDVKEYLVGAPPRTKAHVCDSFGAQIAKRLLHAGASTTEILSIYINVIHAFKLLDPRGVLLEKVAAPIRNYLRARDDTASIIAASFLTEVDEKGNVTATDLGRVCLDIAFEVASSGLAESRDHRALNWDDMNWLPDPIDAPPDYRSSRSDDILAYIIGLFEQEEFVKEVTTLLAQHLLQSTDLEYAKETRLVELFKARLDATKLQAAEVMLKDMRDSVTVNKRLNPWSRKTPMKEPTPHEIQSAMPEEGITVTELYKSFSKRIDQAKFMAVLKLVSHRRNDLHYPKRTRLPPQPRPSSRSSSSQGMYFYVQIVSSFFWPQMRANDFDMPASGFDERKVSFGFEFKRKSAQRKLQYRPALARVTVALELQDRTVREELLPAWRASVIDPFATERGEGDDTRIPYDPEIGLTAQQLQEGLRMEEELVMDALNFWTGKRVLYQKTPGHYAVLERLDMDPGVSEVPQNQAESEAVSAVMSQDAMLRENAPMFETFIANMLRNGGAKEIGGMMGITNMMKMVLPTFTYGDDEVQWLLGEMEGKGQVVRNGELWSVSG